MNRILFIFWYDNNMNIKDKSIIKIEQIASKIMQEKSFGRAYLERAEKNDNVFYHFTSNNNDINLQTLVSDIQSYLDGGKPVLLDVRDYLVKRKSFVRFLARENIADPLLDKLFNCLLNPPSFNIHLDTLKIAFEESNDFAKTMALKICDSYATRQFKTKDVQYCQLILKKLFKFDFKESEYKFLHSFFNYHKEAIIEYPHQMQDLVADFLKAKIKYQNWDDFAQYCPKDPGFKKVENNSLSMVEVNSNPTYNLVINDDAIRVNYPFLSSQTDIKKMMDSLVKLMHKNCNQLGLNKVFYSDWTDKQTFIYLTATSPDSANIKKIENMFFSLIETYATTFVNERNISSEALDKMFQFSYIESSLENKTSPASIKRKI